MKKSALAVFTATIAMVGSATAFPGYTTDPVNMRAGPGQTYPVIVLLGDDQPVEINGCIAQYNWCDVQTGPYRGWVSGQFLQGVYDNRDEFITDLGPQAGVPIISFEIGDYWNRYYRDRPFYSQRGRYANVRHYDNHGTAQHYNHASDINHDNGHVRNIPAPHEVHNNRPGNARPAAEHHDNGGQHGGPHGGDSNGHDRDHH
jgi:uncharacterized protein YraI